MTPDGIYIVPQANLGLLESRIEKLNRRAKKLGVPLITVERVSFEDVPIEQGSFVTRRIFNVLIHGAAPKIAGWEFIATIHPVADETGKHIGNEVRPVPGNEVPAQYRNATLHCDHCHTDRIRKDVFVLQNEDKEFKQVGRNCLRDFLGHTNPEVYAALAEMIQWKRVVAPWEKETNLERYGHLADHGKR